MSQRATPPVFAVAALAGLAAATLSLASACGHGGDSPSAEAPTAPASGCELPAFDAADRTILFGAYEGDAVSTVTVAGRDASTDTARVVIEPGEEPLYVVLSSFQATIWRFEGDTGRVRRLVLVGSPPQGATGIDPSRIHFAKGAPDSEPATGCFAPFYATDTSEEVVAAGFVERQLGRPVDVRGAAYDVGTLALPSATVAAGVSDGVPAGFDPATFDEALRFRPGGLVSVDLAAVVSDGAPEEYEVLPEWMGLAQLVGSGALEPRGDLSLPAEFYIARPIARFPADLKGALAVTFILGRGVPMPAGNPGHSCVLSEETGLPLVDGPSCPLIPSRD